MKKACAVVLSILLMLCLTNVAFASGLETSCVDMALAEAAQIAYLDLEDASAEMREEILAAREKIIFSTDWVADEISSGPCLHFRRYSQIGICRFLKQRIRQILKWISMLSRIWTP